MHDPAAYGELFAALYDGLYPAADPDAIDLLAELARPGERVLELGIGTGRLALPLQARGLAVSGVDASPSMIERLRSKPGGGTIPVAVRDFADLSDLEGAPYDLVFCAFNTFFALLTQEEQVRCFVTAAAALVPGGHFVLEAFVPDLSRFARPGPALVAGIPGSDVYLEASQHDARTQRVSSRLVRIADAGIRVLPIEIRYAWPSELDLMARLGGLEPAGRWAGWRRQPFTEPCPGLVSAWRKPKGP